MLDAARRRSGFFESSSNFWQTKRYPNLPKTDLSITLPFFLRLETACDFFRILSSDSRKSSVTVMTRPVFLLVDSQYCLQLHLYHNKIMIRLIFIYYINNNNILFEYTQTYYYNQRQLFVLLWFMDNSGLFVSQL